MIKAMRMRFQTKATPIEAIKIKMSTVGFVKQIPPGLGSRKKAVRMQNRSERAQQKACGSIL
jgi:hypothetical protein